MVAEGAAVTRDEYASIRAGDIVRSIRTRAPRLVLSAPRPTTGGGLSGIALFKIRDSWTGQNPTAHYDAWSARRLFERTSRRGCSEALATEWATYWHRVFCAALDGGPIPRRPFWPSEWGRGASTFEVDDRALREHVRKWRELQSAGAFRMLRRRAA